MQIPLKATLELNVGEGNPEGVYTKEHIKI